MEHEYDCDTYCNWNTWNDPKRIVKGIERFKDQRASRDHPDYSVVKIGHIIEKNPGDLRTPVDTQMPVKTIRKRWSEKLLKE